MTDRNCAAMAPAKRSCFGPLVIHIDGFAALLGSEGYTPRTVHDKCELVGDLSRWLRRRLPMFAQADTILTITSWHSSGAFDYADPYASYLS